MRFLSLIALFAAVRAMEFGVLDELGTASSDRIIEVFERGEFDPHSVQFITRNPNFTAAVFDRVLGNSLRMDRVNYLDMFVNFGRFDLAEVAYKKGQRLTGTHEAQNVDDFAQYLTDKEITEIYGPILALLDASNFPAGSEDIVNSMFIESERPKIKQRILHDLHAKRAR